MAIVSIEQAREGMVLADRVVDRRGRLLIPPGASLSSRHLEALRIWGVEELEVEVAEGEETAPPALDPALVARAEARADILFAMAGSHPFVAALRREAVCRHARSLARAREPS